MGAAMAEFAAAAEQLGRYEADDLKQAFSKLTSRSYEVCQQSRERAQALAARFEGPLKEAARGMRSAQAAMADRSAALSRWVIATSELQAKQARLAKARATPGLAPSKVRTSG